MATETMSLTDSTSQPTVPISGVRREVPNPENIITAPLPPLDSVERHGFLFGWPIAHSWSPLVHNTVFNRLGLNWGYFLLESTDMKQFLALIRDKRLYGSAVTMPHKVAIIPHLDALTDEGRAVGAVNTTFRRGDQLVGTNTDTIGIRESFVQNVSKDVYQSRPGMVIGGGGAARSAVYALVQFLKCDRVYLNNRDAAEVEAIISWCKSQGYGDGLIYVQTAAEAEHLEAPGAIVACIPDFPPATEAEKEARRVTETFLQKARKGAMLEMCYHPSPNTELKRLGEEHGWQVILGTEAMIYQGLQQHTYWHGRTLDQLPAQEVKDVIARELAKSTAHA